MPGFVVYANTCLVVPIRVSAEAPEQALEKGERIFDEMADEEVLARGRIGAPLDGVFRVDTLDGEILLEKT